MAAPPPVATVLGAIGNTPVVRLQHIVPEHCAQVFLKLESLNPTGSYKDRMALSMLTHAEERGALKTGMTVVEASGGSTGSSLAFVCAVKGYKCIIVSSNAFAEEKLRTIRAFGGEVEIVHSPSGKIEKGLIPEMVKRAEEIAKETEGCFWTDQFRNRDSLEGYRGIGHELVKQFPNGIDAFCGAVGIAGMVMGVSSVLKKRSLKTRVVVLEPESSPVISKGRAGTHGVEGIGVGFVPPLLDRELYDDARSVSEDEARVMCRRLAREGLLFGTSTGINVCAAIALAKELGPGKTVVTVACDTGLKYLNGSLFADG
jgi:cysteine synthase